MRTDLLHGKTCPHCGCPAPDCQPPAKRRGSYERIVPRDASFMRELVVPVECGRCGHDWEIVYAGEYLSQGETRAWFEAANRALQAAS